MHQKRNKKGIFIFAIIFVAFFVVANVSFADSVPPLSPFLVNTSNQITPRVSTNAFQIPSLMACLSLKTDAQGNFSCGTGGGGGSGGGTFSTSTSQVPGQLLNFPNNTTDIVLIGGTSTSTAKFIFNPNVADAAFVNPNGISFTTGTSTFNSAGGINLTKGCFAINGICFAATGGSGFSTTSAQYFLSVNQGNAFSTTSASYFLLQNQGNAFSTTSANFWGTSQGYLTSAVTTLTAGTNITFSSGATCTNTCTINASGGGAVSSVSNADGSLTITPTTGAVVGSLNLAHANIFTALQTFANASSTLFSTTYASSTNYFGAGLSSCNSASNALTYNAGTFGCNTISGSGTVNSGTTGQTGYWASSGTAISATSSDFINTDSTSKFNASPSIANINASTTYGYEGTVNVNSLERSQVSVGLNIFNSAANGSSGVGIGLSNYDPLNTNGGIDPQEFNFVKDGSNFDVNTFWAMQTPTTQSFGRTGIRNVMELHSGGNLDLLALPNAVNNLATPCLTANDGTGTQRGGGVQPIVGGNQLLDAAITKPCATNTLMIDGSQNLGALFYSKSTVTGDVLQPFAFFTNAEFFGVDPRNSGLGTGIPNHFFYLNDSQAASTSAADATEVYGNWSHSPANSGSGGCYMSFYLPGGSSTSTPIDNNHNSACIAAVNNYSLPSDSAGTFGIFSNPSAQYLTGFAQYSTNGGSIYNLDAWNYPYYFLDYLSGQTRFPYQTRDIGNPNQKAYIFTVSGITNAPVYVNSDLYSPDGTSSGRLYQISSYTQNLSGGAGPLTFIGTTTPPASGVMTRIFPTSDSSDFSISYSAVSLAPTAMQWHDSVNFNGKLGLASFGTTTQATSTVTSSFTVTANATSTFSQGINILNGCFSIANICIGGGSGVSIDWLKENNTFGVNSLTPTTTIPLEIKSTASSTFAGGLSSFALLSAPYFNATSTATSTFNGPIQSTCFTTDNITCLNNTYANASAYKQASKYATTAALPANTYVNGAGGVGATLTEVGTGALSVDGASPSIGDRILVKNEVAGANNGIYTVTATGSGIAAYVLTRATDFNSSADVFPGVATYISAGTTNIDDVWALSNTSAVTIGTTALTFAEITSTPLITSVSNSDSTLTISPTTGAVVGSLNLSHANNWISQQNFAAYLGVGTTSPDFRLTVSAGAILNPDFVPGTTTSMTVSFATSTSQTIRIGSSATTINLINALPGAVLRLGIFNPTGVSAGAVTFTSPNNIHWVGAGSANTVPTQTTTAGAFDLWTFTVMSGTSTPVIEGAQLPY